MTMKPKAGTRRAKYGEVLVWRALADETRRKILDQLRLRPMTTGELADAFPLSRFAIMKHLAILADAGFVVVRRKGRQRWNHLNAIPLQQMYERWVRPYEAHWARGLVDLKSQLETTAKEAAMTVPTAVLRPDLVQVELEVRIHAPVDRVWHALISETSRWWRKDFYTIADPAGFVIEPRAGGRMYEYGAAGEEFLWYTVLGVIPGRSLDLSGTITARFGGPVISIVHIKLTEDESSTVLDLSDSLLGNISETMSGETREGWRKLFDEGLKRYVEQP